MTRARTTADITTDAAGLPAGSVIQLKHFSTADVYGTSVVAWSDTPLTLNITPTSTSSKIFIMVSAQIAEDSTSTTCSGRVLRTIGATSTVPGVVSAGPSTPVVGALPHTTIYDATGGAMMRPNSTTNILDTPSTTSEITYTYQITPNGAYAVYFNRYRGYTTWSGVSHITLMEIAG